MILRRRLLGEDVERRRQDLEVEAEAVDGAQREEPARHVGAPVLGARQLRAVPLWLWPLTAALAMILSLPEIELLVMSVSSSSASMICA